MTEQEEANRIITHLILVVGVAQLVERLTVAQVVVGSSPTAHPSIFCESKNAEQLNNRKQKMVSGVQLRSIVECSNAQFGPSVNV